MTREEGAAAQAGTDHGSVADRAEGAHPSDDREPAQPSPHRPGRRSPAALAAILAGGIAAGTLAGTVLSAVPSYELAQVEPADLEAAATSIPPAEAATHIEDAKACRTSMAVLTLRPHPGQGGTVRIRSGDYWSPVIRLANEPLRVAVPFPAPYEVARGDFLIEGNGGADFDVFLRPGWVSAGRQGPSLVHVWWVPKKPC